MALAQLGITTPFTLAAGSNPIAAANSARRYVLCANNDATRTVNIAFGTNNGATAAHFPILPGGQFSEKDADGNLPRGDVAVFGAAGVQITYHEE